MGLANRPWTLAFVRVTKSWELSQTITRTAPSCLRKQASMGFTDRWRTPAFAGVTE